MQLRTHSLHLVVSAAQNGVYGHKGLEAQNRRFAAESNPTSCKLSKYVNMMTKVKLFFVSILVSLEVWAGGKKLNFCRDSKVPGSNLACAPFVVSFSLCVNFKTF